MRKNDMYSETESMADKITKVTGSNRSSIKYVGIAVLCVFLFFILKPFTIIQSGSKGLKFSFGEIHNVVLPEGLNWKIPIYQTIEELTIRPMQLDFQVPVGPDGAITTDNQTIGATLTLFYKYKPSELVSLWQDTGLENIKAILKKTTESSFKFEIGKYTIFDVAPIQNKIQIDTFTAIKTFVSKYPIEVTELRITNYDWPDSFETQIVETMKMAQKVKQKAQDLLVTEQEAQKQVKQAEAKKQALVLESEGRKIAAGNDAEAKKLEGEGIRKFNESVEKNMVLELKLRELDIEKMRVQKWNGQYVPNNMYGPIPFSHGGMQPPPK